MWQYGLIITKQKPKQKCNQIQLQLYCSQPAQEMAYYQRDQLSISTRSKLADYFADLTLITQSVQSFRVALAQTQFFNGIQLFRYLDNDQKGFLTPKDFALLISDEVKKILHYAFSWFDLSKSGQITRIQFLEFLFPRQNPQLRDIITIRMKQQFLPQQKQLSLPMQLDLLRSLILQIMQKQTKLIPRRRSLMDQQDYTLKAVMNCLDVENKGWTTVQDLYKFMKNYDIDVTIPSVCGLLGVYDCDMNGKISMDELQWLVQGLQRTNGKYRNIVRFSDCKARSRRALSQCTCKNKNTNESHQKLVKNKQIKMQTSQKKNQKQNIFSDGKKNIKQLSIGSKNIIDKKLNFSEKKDKKLKISNENKTEWKQNKKSNKKKRASNELKNEQGSNEYFNIKTAFQILQNQTNQIDEDLKQYEQQMGLANKLQMEKQVQNAILHRKIKMQEKERLIQRMQQLQLLRREQERIKIQQEEQQRIIQEENRRILAIQLERERKRIRQLQIQRIRQQQQNKFRQIQIQNIRLRQIEAKRIRQQQIKTKMMVEQINLRQAQKLRKRKLQLQQIEQIQRLQLQRQMLIQKQRQIQRQKQTIKLKNLLQIQAHDREINILQATAQKLAKTDFDWRSQAKLKALHQQQAVERERSQGKYKKQHEYFSKYRNYCYKLAQVADPLGIKEHLAETDKYLIRSRQIRDQIKKDRAVSVNKYSHLKIPQGKNSKQNTQKDQYVEKTPQNRKNIIDTINKRTQQTRLVWS